MRRGDLHGALVLAAPGLSQPSTSPRIAVELLTVVAAANLKLGQADEAGVHFGAAMDLIVSEGLAIVLLRLTPPERAILLADYQSVLDPRLLRELDARGNVVTAPTTPQLSERERVVLRHLVQGHSIAAIATVEHVSPNTIKSQVKAIYRKLGVTDRNGAARVAAAAPHLLA